MKKINLFIVLVFSLTLVYGQADKRLKNIDKDLNAILKATKAAGFSVAVVDGDKIIYSKGFGYKDYENKIPVDANTLFAIGSSTKAFTSALLGILSYKDSLSLDDSPIKYVPKLKFYNDNLNNNIIIKDLMRHSTGLPRHDLSWYLFPSADKDSLIDRIVYQQPFTGLRQEWHYNNFMFLVQGVIAEKITGISWEDNIRSRFFQPLKMNHSRTSLADLKNDTNVSLGYELDKDEHIAKMDYYDISGMSPAGSIYSSANDMAQWLKLWINKGKLGDTQILPENYVNEAISSQMVTTGALPDTENPDLHFSNYGYGWMLSSFKGHYRVEHGGNIDGFSANVAFFPSDSIGIVVLTNQNGSSLPNLVRNTIADRLLNVKKTDWIKSFLDRKEKAKKMEEELKLEETATTQVANTRPSHAMYDYTGSYENPGYGKFDVNIENDSLFAQFKRSKVYLKHYHYDVFQPFQIKNSKIDTTDVGLMFLNFSTGDGGAITNVSLKAETTLDPISFKRTPNTIEVSSNDLQKYVGDYSLMGATLKIYIKKENVLYLFVPGQPEYELVPTDKNKFSLKIADGFKVEFLETDGVITDLNLMQPNGTFKAKKV